MILPVVSLLNKSIVLEPIKEPSSEKAMPETAIPQTTFFLRIKLMRAVPVPIEAANLLAPRATWGGRPASSREGRSRRPPPAILSMNPARKETPDKIIVIVVISKSAILLLCSSFISPANP